MFAWPVGLTFYASLICSLFAPSLLSPFNADHHHLLPGPLSWLPQPRLPLQAILHIGARAVLCLGKSGHIISLSKLLPRDTIKKMEDKLQSTHLQNGYLINDLCPEYVKNSNNSKKKRLKPNLKMIQRLDWTCAAGLLLLFRMACSWGWPWAGI